LGVGRNIIANPGFGGQGSNPFQREAVGAESGLVGNFMEWGEKFNCKIKGPQRQGNGSGKTQEERLSCSRK